MGKRSSTGYGRVEVRRYQLVPDLSTLPKPEQWKDLQGIARVEGERHLGNRVSTEVRYYITSFGQDVGRLAEAVRGHWGIESAPQAHRRKVHESTNQLCISCTGDEDRPFGVGFQEQASNPSKLLRSRAVGSERWSQSAEAYLGQVRIRKANNPEPLWTRRKPKICGQN